MSIFAILMIAGLLGLVLMALPGLNQHSHAGPSSHSLGDFVHHAGPIAGGHSTASNTMPGAHRTTHGGTDGTGGMNSSWFRMIPSPRVIFSLLTLFGAFGYALVGAAHLTPMLAGLIAVIPTLLLERFAVTPVWKMLFRFQGKPCAPLQELVLNEATAVTPFRNGRGLASVVHEGRVVQLRAELIPPQLAMPVRVGDTLLIEEIDAANERITVSVR